MGYPKDRIPLDPLVLLIAMRSFSRFMAIWVICAFASTISAGEGDKPLELRRNVLRVSSEGAGGNGFGFVVSERAGRLYIVTADHVVASTPDIPAPSIKVAFFTDQGKSYKAEVLKHKADHDLALLVVDTPPGFTWEKQCLASAREATRGTAVWFIGRDEEWYVPAASGLISSLTPSADGWLNADMPNLRPGSSGGPLVANTGIVGMVKARSVDDIRVLSIEYIKNAVRDWGYQWDLINPSEINTVVRPAGATTIGFQNLTVDDRSPFTSYTESGFTVQAASGSWLVGRQYGNPSPYIYFVTTSGAGALGTASIVVTAAGKPFTFRSADIYSSVTSIPYSLVGLKNGAKIFAQTGVIPNTFGRFAQMQVEDEYKELVIDKLKMELSSPAIGQSVGSNPIGVDNIVVVTHDK